MVFLGYVLRLNRLRLRILGLNGHKNRRNARKAFHVFELPQYSGTVPSHSWRSMLPLVRVIFRLLRRNREHRLSIGLVDSSVLGLSARTFSRCLTNNSSKASRNQSAADLFLVRSHASNSCESV